MMNIHKQTCTYTNKHLNTQKEFIKNQEHLYSSSSHGYSSYGSQQDDNRPLRRRGRGKRHRSRNRGGGHPTRITRAASPVSPLSGNRNRNNDRNRNRNRHHNTSNTNRQQYGSPQIARKSVSFAANLTRSKSMDDGTNEQFDDNDNDDEEETEDESPEHTNDDENMVSGRDETMSIATNVTTQSQLVDFGVSTCRELEQDAEMVQHVWQSNIWKNNHMAKDLCKHILKHSTVRNMMTDHVMLEYLMSQMDGS